MMPLVGSILSDLRHVESTVLDDAYLHRMSHDSTAEIPQRFPDFAVWSGCAATASERRKEAAVIIHNREYSYGRSDGVLRSRKGKEKASY
jgi:hypothetical protein